MSRKKRNNKKLPLILISIFILLLIVFAIIFLDSKNPIEIVLNSELKAEINSEAKVSDFITSINTGEMISDDTIIDTTKLGKQQINIQISYKEKNYNYNFEIEVVDTIQPIIEAKDEISIYVGNSIDLFQDVIITDNSNDTELKPTIEGNYDFNVAGSYNLTYVVTDKAGNKTIKDFVLNVIEDPNNRVITTSKGYTLKISNGVASIDGIVIANKSYGLPSTYGNGLTSETINAFNSMQADAATAGISLYNISGYRSYYDQQYIYNNYVARDGQAEADRYSARPGHSEHQTGMAIDVNSLYQSFEYTTEGVWLNNNCYKYGFIIRYPKNKESITGYMFEPWHVRYVGVELATTLYNNGDWITVEEYFGIDSKY